MKEYFLALAPEELAAVLDRYEEHYGTESRERAELSVPGWRAGSVRMSGRVARRLYGLVPPLMPVELRYRIVERLWQRLGAPSHRTLHVGLDVDVGELAIEASRDIDEMIERCGIPQRLHARFGWLAAADVVAKQVLLRHGCLLEKQLILDALAARLPAIQRHLRGEAGRHTTRLAQIFAIGRHELEIVVDRRTRGVERVVPRASRSRSMTRATFGTRAATESSAPGHGAVSAG